MAVAALRQQRQQLQPISGAEQTTYTIAPEDVGHTLEVSETA